VKPPILDILKVRDFNGIITDADTGDLPPGAAQWSTNVSSRDPGSLKVRDGLLEVTFDGDSQLIAETNHCIGIHTFAHTSEDIIVFQLDDGSIRVGRTLGIIA